MTAGSVLAQLMTFGMKAVYTAILSAIVLLCASEFYRIWFDRSPVLAAFDYVENGELKTESGRSFTHILVQQQHLLRNMLAQQSAQQPILTEEATLENRNLRIADLETSNLDDVKIEAYGFKVTDLLSQMRDWFRQPNRITGRIDKLGDQYRIFASWRANRAGAADDGRRFYNRMHKGDQEASFRLAAHLVWQNILDQDDPGPLSRSLIANFSADDFADFMAAWSFFRQAVGAVRPIAEQQAELSQAQAAVEGLIGRDKNFPPLYNLAAHLRLLATPLDRLKDTERAQISRLLTTYLDQLTQLGLATDKAARSTLAALAQGELAAERVSVAYRAARASAGAVRPDDRTPAAPAAVPRIALAGASISPEGVPTAASSCCVVEDRKGDRFLITADYLFTPETLARGGSTVISPAVTDGGTAANRIGRFERRHAPAPDRPGIALIRLDATVDASNQIPGVGLITATADVPSLGGTVKLFGRSSRLTSGHILAGSLDFMGTDLVAAERLSQAGDGGAPVLDADDRLIGMLYAGSADKSGILPLKPILEELGLTLLAG